MTCMLLIEPIFPFIMLNSIKSINLDLGSLRNWLLPMLMNGQVRMKEEEMMMAAQPEKGYKTKN